MYRSYQYFHFISGAFKASLIGIVYAMLATTAGVGSSLGKTWGRFLLNVVSVLALLYALMFVLWHGYMDRSLGYVSCIVALSVIATVSLVVVNGRMTGAR